MLVGRFDTRQVPTEFKYHQKSEMANEHGVWNNNTSKR